MRKDERNLATTYYLRDIYPLHNAIGRYVATLCGDLDLANEVTADVMAMAWHRVFDVHAMRDPKRYLMRCAKNRLIDYLRTYGRVVYIGDPGEIYPDAGPDIIAQLIRADEYGRLATAIKNLTLIERRIILMYYVYDECLADIARWMRLPVSTVATIKRRALSKMRTEIGDLTWFLFTNKRARTPQCGPKGTSPFLVPRKDIYIIP